MSKLKLAFILMMMLVLAAGCHAGIEEGDEVFCQDVEDVYEAVQTADLDSGIAREEVYSDIAELGSDGHCPGYEVVADD